MLLNMCCPVVLRGAFSPNVQIEISTNNLVEINIECDIGDNVKCELIKAKKNEQI